jgi:hypothetical protein
VPHPSSLLPAHARRALIEDIKEDKKGWLRHGVAALAVSVLGLGVAGSVVLTGAAQHTTSEPHTTVQTDTSRSADKTSRDSARDGPRPAKVQSLADQRAEELSKAEDDVAEAATDKGAKAREKASSLPPTRPASRRADRDGKAEQTTAGSSGTPRRRPDAGK